jgi:hypothetical protein
MTQKENLIALLIILFARTAFLFGDAFFSTKQINTQFAEQNMSNIEKKIHSSANDDLLQNSTIEIPNNTISDNIISNIETNLEKTKTKINSIKTTITNSTQDIQVLEKIYQQEENPDVLKALLQKLVEDYQFDKAKQYIANINIFQDEGVDVKTYIYTYINSLSITDSNSMDKFMSFVDQMRYKSMI